MSARIGLALLVLTVGTSNAWAVDKTFNVTSGWWSIAGNWDPSGAPDADDRAIIPSDKICLVNLTNVVADRINVDGRLEFFANTTLTLDGDDGGSTIDGLVFLTQGATLAFTENSHTVDGDGTIEGDGFSAHAKIQIASGITMTSDLDVTNKGIIGDRFTIAGPGTFYNSGNVVATVTSGETGSLVLASDCILDDDSGALWSATGGCSGNTIATLEFRRDADALVGAFTLTSDGIFKFDGAIVKTCGGFTYSDGKLDFENSGVFLYYPYAGTCPNPTDIDPDLSCSSPYMANRDNDCGCP